MVIFVASLSRKSRDKCLKGLFVAFQNSESLSPSVFFINLPLRKRTLTINSVNDNKHLMYL